MSKKDKKNKKLFGMIDLNNPMMIGVVVVLFLLCVYLGVVLILEKPWNILEWFKTVEPVKPANEGVPLSSQAQQAQQAALPSADLPADMPRTLEDAGIDGANTPFKGGKLLKKLRRR